MYCERCQKPIAAQKTTHGIRNALGRTDELRPFDLSEDADLRSQVRQIAQSLGLSLGPATKAT